MRDWRTAEEVGSAHGVDTAAIAVVLNFLACTSDLILRRNQRFCLAPKYSEQHAWRGVVEKIVGAYGALLRRPVASLRPGSTENAIDRRALTRAYSWDTESAVVIDTIVDLHPAGVLDIGCGRGKLLVATCRRPPVRGWGVDPSNAMCTAARSAVAAAALEHCISIRRGTALTVDRALSVSERRGISVIHAGSLLNEFARDETKMVVLLRRFTHWFPGRSLVVVDYLGALSDQTNRAGSYTCLTDLVQTLSGQGVPPTSHDRWNVIYRAAGARLVSILESRTLDLRWFVHVVRLGGKASRVS
jgi:SAM-dependent methyltransferase